MIRRTYIIFRPDTSVEFWHCLPEIKLWMESIEADMISRGLLLSCKNSISDDGLIFTRVTEYTDEESYLQMRSLINPTSYDQIRMEYNDSNSHIFFSSEEEVT
jgi:hypothetical protein